MANTCAQLYIHFVFSVKERENLTLEQVVTYQQISYLYFKRQYINIL